MGVESGGRGGRVSRSRKIRGDVPPEIMIFLLSGLHRRFIFNFGDDVVLHISTRKQVNNNKKKLTGATNKVRAKRIRQLVVLIELRWLVINVRNGLGSATRVNKHMKCNITDAKVTWTTRHATIRLLSLRGRRLPRPQSRRSADEGADLVSFFLKHLQILNFYHFRNKVAEIRGETNFWG